MRMPMPSKKKEWIKLYVWRRSNSKSLKLVRCLLPSSLLLFWSTIIARWLFDDFSNSGTLTRKLELRKMSDIYLPVKIIGSSLCDFQFNQSINDLAKMVCFIETPCCKVAKNAKSNILLPMFAKPLSITSIKVTQ